MKSPIFSVLTPTFNRARTLGRVYEALQAQTLKDFEWIIVDDGSADGTADLVQHWLTQDALRIKYLRKSNGGKHTAYNAALRLAEGEFAIVLDSDDACVPHALERLLSAWQSIPQAHRGEFTGVSCFCRKEPAPPGEPDPRRPGVIDGHAHVLIATLGLHDEMWGMHRLDVLKAFPFPEYAKERFCPEGLVWNRISATLKTRIIPDELRLYFSSDDSLSSRSVEIRRDNPHGTADYYHELLRLDPRPGTVLRCAANLHRFNGWRYRNGRLGLPPTLLPTYLLGAALGRMVRVRDSLRARRASRAAFGTKAT